MQFVEHAVGDNIRTDSTTGDQLNKQNRQKEFQELKCQ